MANPIRIDFVSDVVCPWCAIGVASLSRALEQLGDEVSAEIHFHPFELSPEMGKEGENVLEYLSAKYGSSHDQIRETWNTITERGGDVGFTFNFKNDSRKWNTFNAHRLLMWAGETSGAAQLALKMALLKAGFTDNRCLDDNSVLLELVAAAGLDVAAASGVLESDAFAEEVRQEEQEWQEMGVRSVPTMVFNRRYAVSGGQPPAALVQVLRKVASEPADQ
ncbi:DsbA family oxidoreductase [Parathalassolituus penaei]|uniref:DsbA family oxidoreductase n=1 Tax=Parathalassolituus penaei TaxID=2997323 RepID=A0A9X3EM43_9GAMM|nr:DsbA family oxidoreductase [Parathalassolituus penaei]MCY0965158.1 DsbA family oxidoreductase [Parathalassolituus penaei]